MLKKYTLNLLGIDLSNIKVFATYLVTNVFIFLLPLAVTPILARYLSTDDFGVWAIYLILTTYFTHFVRFELNLVTKRVYKLQPNLFPQIMFVSSVTIFLLGGVLCLFIAFGHQLAVSSLGEDSYFVWIALGGAVLKAFSILAHGYMQISGKFVTYSAINIVSSYLLYSLMIFLVVTKGLGVNGRVWADIVITLAVALHALWYLHSNGLIKMSFHISVLKANIVEAWSPFILSFFVISFANLDKILIGWALDKSQLGTFVVALQFASLLTVLTSSLAPVIEKLVYTPESDIKIKTGPSFLIMIFAIIFTLILSKIVSLAIYILMPEEFYQAADYSLLACISVLASFIVAMGVAFVNSISNVRKIFVPFSSLVLCSFASGFILFSVSPMIEHLAYIYLVSMILFIYIIYSEYKATQ